MALTRELNELVCRYDKYAELLAQPRCGTWAQRLRLRLREYELDNAPGSGPNRPVAELRPAAKLLDVGAGTGGQTISVELTGCDFVVVDLPLRGFDALGTRAADNLSQRCEVVAADNAALPFRTLHSTPEPFRCSVLYA